MAKKDDAPQAGISRDRMHNIIDFARRGLFQEITTETGATIRTNRPRKIDTLETLDRALTDYLNYMDDMNARRADGEKPYFMTIAGFCVFCGMSRDSYDRIKCNEPAVTERLKTFETFILQGLQQAGLNGDAATIPLMAELNNNHGYTNAPQVVRHEVVSELPSVDDIARRLPGE